MPTPPSATPPARGGTSARHVGSPARGGTGPCPAPPRHAAGEPRPGSYRALVQGEAFALRYPSTGYTRFDLDTPKAMPLGSDVGQTEIVYAHLGGVRDSHELLFQSSMGPSEDTSPERCRMAAGANALSPKLDAAQVRRQIVPGLVLCGITKQNKLAMTEVTSVSDDGRPGFRTRPTFWEMP